MRGGRWHEARIRRGGGGEGARQALECASTLLRQIDVRAEVRREVVRCAVVNLRGCWMVLKSACAELLKIVEVHRVGLDLLSVR